MGKPQMGLVFICNNAYKLIRKRQNYQEKITKIYEPKRVCQVVRNIGNGGQITSHRGNAN